ncbi:MAG: bifunctional (p)ppGpp synthetase/guanosine-3',5'-bis(diphosphate) 3'-pyrophosphohydrolase [Bacteroidales bacterium]|nr:bifunctional (p)ppGpp synthetase/guanosine-3',5'-bis(diphosphate) 3'-pyrophosphohydrolase [Bacteroidales bacterium]
MADLKQNIDKKQLESYKSLLTNLVEQKGTKTTGAIDKAFDTLIQKRSNDKTFYGKSLVVSVLNSAVVAVNEIGLGKSSVISLFLYYAFEKEGFDAQKIKTEYDETVWLITEGLTKISKINEKTSSSQAENFRRLLLNLAKDVRVILIRLAEQSYLMRQMNLMAQEEQVRIASEAMFLYAPLAHRLGLYLIKSEMEDLSLKFTNRDTYNMIARKLATTMKARKVFIEEFIGPIGKELKKQGFEFEMKGRPKSIHSIWNKMKRKGVEFEDIYDLFAIRIILKSELKNEKADCWQVYSAVTDIFQPNPLRLRDWISVPKTNGYESLHTTVIGPGGRWVEVQIRSERMNEIAEKGVAAHWKYKGLEGEQGIDEWLAKIRDVLETPEPDVNNFIDDFKLSLYSKEIFAFTPKGDLRKFPEGATVLDFAYDIHTDVGATCTGARVNGRNVPIRYRLQNGDKVEIQTSKNQMPKLDWLNFAVTTKAQKKIRQRLNEDKVKEAEIGKEIIKRRFKNWKVEYSDDIIRRILKNYRLPNAQEFYCNVSNGKIELSEIKDFITSEEAIFETETTSLEEFETTRKAPESEKTSEDVLIIDGKLKNIDYKLAKCCSPIMGDSIFGFVTINEGIKIHRTNCPNAAQMIGKYGYRVVKAKWTSKSPESLFSVDISIRGEDDPAILNSISEALAKDLKVSVRSISLNASEGLIQGTISLKVRNLKQLDFLLSRLSAIKGIYSVQRFEGN